MRIKNILIILILLSTLISPKCYGQSKYTDQEIKEWHNHEIHKLESAIVLTDYMYNRIKFYQEFDTWYERLYAIEYMYKALQEMENK